MAGGLGQVKYGEFGLQDTLFFYISFHRGGIFDDFMGWVGCIFGDIALDLLFVSKIGGKCRI